jgi:hypothetical protein
MANSKLACEINMSGTARQQSAHDVIRHPKEMKEERRSWLFQYNAGLDELLRDYGSAFQAIYREYSGVTKFTGKRMKRISQKILSSQWQCNLVLMLDSPLTYRLAFGVMEFYAKRERAMYDAQQKANVSWPLCWGHQLRVGCKSPDLGPPWLVGRAQADLAL